MKNIIRISSIISFILVGIAMLSCTTQPPVEQEEKKSLEGVWEFVSGEWTMQDSIMTYPGPQTTDIRSFKFITEKYWGVAGMIPSNDMNWGFAGTYRLTDDTYIEYFLIQGNPESIRDSAVYKYKLDGDRFWISSDWSKEEWKRIE